MHGKASDLDQQAFFIKGMQLLSFVDLDRKFAKANITARDRRYDKQYIKAGLGQLMRLNLYLSVEVKKTIVN